MRFLFLSLFILPIFLFSCTPVEKENVSRSVFQIEWQLARKNIIWVWVCISERSIMTSAHVVADDRYRYTASGLGMVAVSSRFPLYDTATLDILSGSSCIPERISQKTPQIGDRVFASVFRSGEIATLTGKIIELEKQGIGYSENGMTHIFTSRILSDISFLPGDSGAPLFNSDYELIDIVHTAP